MAVETQDTESEDIIDEDGTASAANGDATAADADDEEASEEEDEEPRLKYASLTKHLKPIYRNGDATSTFLVAGDKMVREMARRGTLGND